MRVRQSRRYTALFAVLSVLCVTGLAANTAISVEVEQGADKADTVDAAFDVNVRLVDIARGAR